MGWLSGILVGWAAGYAAMLWGLWRAFCRGEHRHRQLPTPTSGLPFVSILTPARNEAIHIEACLASLLAQHYPSDRFEIIVIDDHSTDDTAARVQACPDPRVRLLSLARHLHGARIVAYKKAALAWGVAEARGELILTTDADCVAPPGWLASHAAAYARGAGFITAPVCIASQRPGLLVAFQALDVAGVMALTGGTTALGYPLLANGANLGFSRHLFRQLGGYAGHEHQPSGDDVLLLQKVTAHQAREVVFLFEQRATVATAAAESWGALWRQRLRWAAKTSAYRNWRLVALQAFVFGLCWGILLALCMPALALGAALAWGIKSAADFFYLRAASRWFGFPHLMRWFVPSQLLHTLYIAVVGAVALLPVKPRWKGR